MLELHRVYIAHSPVSFIFQDLFPIYGHIFYNSPLPDEPRKGQTSKTFIHFLGIECNRLTVLYNSDQYRVARTFSKIGNVASHRTVPSHLALSHGGLDTKCLSTDYCVRVFFVVRHSLVYPAPLPAAKAITLYLPRALTEISTDAWSSDH